jgi:hypothetical protein
MLPATIPDRLHRGYAFGSDLGTCGNYPGFDETPERDE